MEMNLLSVKNLKVAAKQFEIGGISQMNKTELIEKIEEVAVQPKIEELVEMNEVVIEEVTVEELANEVAVTVEEVVVVENESAYTPLEMPAKAKGQKVKWPLVKFLTLEIINEKFHMFVSEEGEDAEWKFVKTYAKAPTAEFHFDRVLNEETNGLEVFMFEGSETTVEAAFQEIENRKSEKSE